MADQALDDFESVEFEEKCNLINTEYKQKVVKEKEYVKLWEDFLIYAVVLEENETIINKLSKF